MSKVRYVFDIEANGLLDEATKIWIAVVINADTGKEYIFSDYVDFTSNDHVNCAAAFIPFLEQADEIIGHNIIDYDLQVLKKLADWVPPPNIMITDTLILSQAMDYKRFGFGHALDKWGTYFGLPKPEIEEWGAWDPSMVERCLVDTRINLKVYIKTRNEVLEKASRKPEIKKSIAAEHESVKFFSQAKERGWLIDVRKLKITMTRMHNQMESIRNIVEPQMPGRIKPKYGYMARKDPEDPKESKTRKPLYIKNGNYSHHTVNLFGIEPERGQIDSDRPIAGEFTPIEYHAPDINSIESVKQFLVSVGWEPLEYNRKKVGNHWMNMSPKLCEVSLSKVGRVGEYIDRYNTTSSRYSIMKGWYDNLDKDNRLHGSAFSIGTPTFRCRHKGIVNVPSTKAHWGAAMRAVFICDEGNVIVGGDSKGNQARALCHEINDPAFTHLILDEDIHVHNATILTTDRAIVDRNAAKTWYYAWLFGAGGNKLSRYILGVNDYEFGMELSAKFLDSYPKLKDLIARLEAVYKKTDAADDIGGRAYIPAVDGRRVYADSPHKLLNYRLQSTEAVTCKAALLYAVRKLNEEKIPWWPLIFYHDELQIETPKKYADRVAEILVEAFTEAPKWFGITIMGGTAKIGKSWLQTH